MEQIKKKLAGIEDFGLYKTASGYIASASISQEINLSSNETKTLVEFYIQSSYILREKYNEKKILSVLKSLFESKIFDKTLEFNEIDLLQFGISSLHESDLSISQEDLDDSYSEKPKLQLSLMHNNKVDKVISVSNKLMNFLLESAFSSHSNSNKRNGVTTLDLLHDQIPIFEYQDNKENCKEIDEQYMQNYEIFYQSEREPPLQQHHSFKLFHPEIVEKLISDPVCVQINLMKVNEKIDFDNLCQKGTVISNLSQILENMNIKLEVKNLQINFHLGKKNQLLSCEKQLKLYKNFVSQLPIDLYQIYTTQILEVHLFLFAETQKLLDFEIHSQKSIDDPMKIYAFRVKLYHTLTAAIINDFKVQLVNAKDDPSFNVKTVYFSSGVMSNQFKYLDQYKNISFIHTRQFLDNHNFNYLQYRFPKKEAVEISQKNSENDFSRSFHSIPQLEEDEDEEEEDNMSESNFEIFMIKKKKDNQISIFDVQKQFLESSFSNTFIFTTTDAYSKQLEKLYTYLSYPFNLEEMVHSKSLLIYFFIAFKKQMYMLLQSNPTFCAWDLFL